MTVTGSTCYGSLRQVPALQKRSTNKAIGKSRYYHNSQVINNIELYGVPGLHQVLAKRCVRLASTVGDAELLQQESVDVSTSCVNPVIRSMPVQASRKGVQLLFVSESNVCRSVLAEAYMKQLLIDASLGAEVDCDSKGTRDYCVGEGPEESVQEAAKQLGLRLRDSFQARQFDPAEDIVKYDMILVMDKFTAADVLREVSVYDTIQKDVNYSAKIRLLGEFHPVLATKRGSDARDIDDPLYGNVGGQQELDEVMAVSSTIRDSCVGLRDYLMALWQPQVPSQQDRKQALAAALKNMESVDWLVPPMLSR